MLSTNFVALINSLVSIYPPNDVLKRIKKKGQREDYEGKSNCCPRMRNCIQMQHARTKLAVAVISCNISTMHGRVGGLQRLAGCHPSFEFSEVSCLQGVRQSDRLEDTLRLFLGPPWACAWASRRPTHPHNHAIIHRNDHPPIHAKEEEKLGVLVPTVISALERSKQDCYEFEASPGLLSKFQDSLG